MPAKGQTQSDETKKKISEALQKDGSDSSVSEVKRSPEAQKMYNDYVDSMKKGEELMSKRDSLKESLSKMKRGKANTAQRKAVRAKIAEIQKIINQERKKREAIRKQAMAAKKVKQAEIFIAKANIRTKQIETMERKIQDRIAKAKTPEAKERYKQILQRSSELRTKISERIKESEQTIKTKGEDSAKGPNAFNFEEHECSCHEHLEDLPYKPFRELLLQEKRCNLEYLNEEFNNLQKQIEQELTEITNEEYVRFVTAVEKKITAGDIAGLAALLLLIRGKVKKTIDNKLIQAYEAGKKTAAGELQVERPTTPLFQTQLKNFEVSDISEEFIGNIESTAKNNIRNGLAVGAATGAIITTTLEKMKKESEKEIKNIAGTFVGQYINRGRRLVFEQNMKRVIGFIRSEVLDLHTCEMCISLDKMVIKADDPMSKLDQVHTNCRGLWVPMFEVDEEKPEITGVPSFIMDNFELIDGRPVINQFKQIKKPTKEKK